MHIAIYYYERSTIRASLYTVFVIIYFLDVKLNADLEQTVFIPKSFIFLLIFINYELYVNVKIFYL